MIEIYIIIYNIIIIEYILRIYIKKYILLPHIKY